tara:strand:+ start:29 stop:271 length:243 start_codon:yes stop_codon:yes gene_type:complete
MEKQTSEFKDYSQFVEKNKSLSWLLSKYENASDRYMEAEDFILQIAEMKWYQRIFCLHKILIFLDSRSKYNGIIKIKKSK